MNDLITLTYQEWLESYKPDSTEYDKYCGEAYLYESISQMDYIRDTHNQCIWSLIDADGELIIVNGAHIVNRLGYYVTSEKWALGTDYQIILEEESYEN